MAERLAGRDLEPADLFSSVISPGKRGRDFCCRYFPSDCRRIASAIDFRLRPARFYFPFFPRIRSRPTDSLITSVHYLASFSRDRLQSKQRGAVDICRKIARSVKKQVCFFIVIIISRYRDGGWAYYCIFRCGSLKLERAIIGEICGGSDSREKRINSWTY